MLWVTSNRFAGLILTAVLALGAVSCGGGSTGPRFLNSDLGGCDGGCPCTADNQCSVALPRCDKDTGACVACLPTNDNCGLGKKCVANVCLSRCDKDGDCPKADHAVSCCQSGCVDSSRDIANCGGCGKACPVPANATAACTAGMCGIGACKPGFADCDKDAANGCEVDLRTDVKSCGACATPCVAGPNQTNGCAMGMCTPTCSAGFAHCSNNPMDGCEVDTRTSTAHCGGCGMACPVVANGSPSCSQGQCGIAQCNGGFADCDRSTGNGCEANLSSLQNCGSCGNVCGQVPNGVPGCVGGQCGLASCNVGFGDCDNAGFNGCETNLKISANNCGQCGNTCFVANGVGGCANSQCTVASCNNGFDDCNKLPGDGCEVSYNTDARNCGFCGNVCPMNAPSCIGGVCKANSYLPVGVQLNVATSTVTNAGWIECYRDLYSNSGTLLNTITGNCPGSRLMLACAQVGSNTLLVAAQAPRADVLFPVVGNVLHNANSVGWYYDTASSWGFAAQGDVVARNSCDTTAGTNRICWHTSASAINGGYRCGNTTGLNASALYNRIVYRLP